MAKKFYAVRNGKSGNGIYLTWEECKTQVQGAKGVSYKGFGTRQEAEDFLQSETPEKAESKSGGKKKGDKQEPPPHKEGVAVAYVDGSYLAETKEFSCGAVLFYQGETVCFSKKYNDPDMVDMHNVAGEIMGAVSVIAYCLEKDIPALEIYHDYEGVAKWARGEWKANKPGTKAYSAMCARAKERLKLTFVKVKGHSGDTWNDMADRLAKDALGIA